jgi:hypothetical protein
VNAVLAAVVVLVPPIVGVGFVFAGLSRGWLRWPWLVGAGFAFVPAVYLTFQSACRQIGGTCPRAAELRASHWAVVGLVSLVAGMIVAATGRRAALAVGLIGVGELWMVDRLAVAGESSAAALLALLLAVGVAVEAFAALRERALTPRGEQP